MHLTLAPILLFTYKRLNTLKSSVAALQQNYQASESELFIFSDAAKTPHDEIEIANVRSFIKNINGFKNVSIIEANKNRGLANSIISGVTQIIQEYEKVIVLEDDLVTSPNFLNYMNQALSAYKDNLRVFSIAGYTIPVTILNDYQFDTYFLPRASSWGWATWKNRWVGIDWKMSTFMQLKKDRVQIKAFNQGGSDMYDMLKKQVMGKIDSWAIRWCYHQFKSNTYTLYPIISKVQNIGFNNMATHTHVYNRYATPLDKGEQMTFSFPSEVVPDKKLLSQFQSFYSLKMRAIGKIKTYLYKAGLYKNK